ncbi:MAG: NAD(+) diphosphatase [Paracoccaceae bacterium]
MEDAVTFSAGHLARAAHLRGPARPDAGARVCAMWRGKPLMGETGLGWVAGDHPALAQAPMAFLGEGAWAADLSAWAPAEVAETVGAFTDPSRQVHPDLPGAFAELRAVMLELSALDAECAATARGLFEWHRTHPFCPRCGTATVPAMSGWQRDCPGCGARHFPRMDPVVIMLVTRGDDLLIGRSPHWPERMYSLLAGFLEPGETVEAAVRRETFEEAGVVVGPVAYLASQPWPWPGSLMLGCRGEALSEAITCDPAELEDAIWVSRERLAAIFRGEDAQVAGARAGAIAHALMRAWLEGRLD